ncbi:MAG: plasmid replication protein, CyRepA1 family, partial [Spirulinaceae cyanobacterium]
MHYRQEGYLQEWSASGVDAELTRLNVRSLNGSDPYDYLLYAEDLPRRNDGRLRQGILQRYQHLEAGGWWCSGVDLLSGSEDPWGCFKPSQPRQDGQRQKLIKYEHPPKTATGLFALRVPQHVWDAIATRYNHPFGPEDLDLEQPDQGFWQWFLARPDIPLCVTEGAKKAGALLTAGFVAIALPGVHGGYRTPRDGEGNKIGRSHLIPQLELLTRKQRPVYMVFDQDQKPQTIQAVNGAIRHTAYLLERQGCDVRVVTWNPELGKGVDDLLIRQGDAAFEQAYDRAPSFEAWKAQTFTQLTYPAALTVNQRYLPALAIPDGERLIGIKSPKGTGKTHCLEAIVKGAIARGQWVLVIGHRVKLVESLCERFGLRYISELQPSDGGPMRGYGLCIDSLHPHSQAHFQAADWRDGVVIIDEVEQVLWHGLNASTCRGNRVAILKSLKTLMQNVLGGQGQVYVADADLSDVALDYLRALAGCEQSPYLIQNQWQPGTETAWTIHHYDDSSPDRLMQALEQHICAGGKPFVCLSAQKPQSQWGTSNLESYLRQQFPQHKILRLDSETLTNAHHPAAQGLQNLDERLQDYDIVLSSPCLETGVSIDLQGHFTSIWAIAQGIQAENSVRQALSRVREPLPRHLWVAPFGFNTVGNGSTSIAGLLESGQKLTQLNIRLLQQSDLTALDDLETGFQAESLLCWA